ncbi:hypothetical protein ECZU01_42910 [Escherichia coli]|nr:hypothetical protein ECZU01_42910 [Escherichia coli]
MLVDRPDKKGRLDILKVHVKKVTLARDVDLEQVAALTTGFSGADLANRVNEAALAARRRRASAVELQDFTATIERIVAGPEKKSRVLNPRSGKPWPITRWAMRWWRWRCPKPTPYTRSRSSRAASARWATPCSAPPKTAS